MPTPSAGSEFGHYRLSRLIGSGGMGEVYLARDLALERDVAIKFVTADGVGDETLSRRLVLEAKAVASLDHPGICPVYDAGVNPDGGAYMVMQYVPGETLAARLKRGPLAPDDATGLCAQIAEALGVAHQAQIVHRDLKPQNVIVTPAGQVKLVDFGIAKVLSPASADWETVSALTKSYAILGTPAYMSPEQAQQHPVDGRSDLFALGSIFFECLTGRRAFTGQTPLEVITNIAHEPPPLVSAVRPELGTRYDEVCRRLMAKKPDERFQTTAEVLAAFDALPKNRVFTLSRRAILGVAAAVLVLVAAVSYPRFLTPRLPEVPVEAKGWFDKGTTAIREGSYYQGVIALEQGIQLFPDYPMAYLLLAEARRELDDIRAAENELKRLDGRFPDESRLPNAERLRLSAIRFLLLGNVDGAVRVQKQLAEGNPNDAWAWVDLGRSQEAAAQMAEAKGSYQRAIKVDSQNASAHLRLGILEATDAQSDRAAATLDKAERLYKTASNPEGLTEVLIRRGVLLDNLSEFAGAVEALQRALTMAQTNGNPHQIVRAQMRLSSSTASLGRFSQAEQLATAGVTAALDAKWDAIAADGLVDLGTVLVKKKKYEDAARYLDKAAQLAEGRKAERTAARARTQRALLHVMQNEPREALKLLADTIEYFRKRGYRLQELDALSIAVRAHRRLDEFDKAHTLSAELLRVAKLIHDDVAIAEAVGNMASSAAALGKLPDALGYWEEVEKIVRKSGSDRLPFDLANRAEVLIRLGRIDEAMGPIEEIERGIAKGLEVYITRQPRVHLLRAQAALAAGDYALAARHASRIDVQVSAAETAAIVGPALLQFANSQRKQRLPSETLKEPSGDPPTLRERRFLLAWACVAAGDSSGALKLVSVDLDRLPVDNDELRWRLAALGAAASRQLGQSSQYETLRKAASDALRRLRLKWGPHAAAYDGRKDLAALRASIGV